jgi:invasion protein IalB
MTNASSSETVNAPVGAAEGCDLLTLIFYKQDQKIAAFGSSYMELRLAPGFSMAQKSPEPVGAFSCAAQQWEITCLPSASAPAWR